MREQQMMVKEFHRLFNYTANDTPTIPSEEDCRHRVNLIQEELDELEDALACGDMVEIADALGDLLYVVLGGGVICGLDMKPIFEEIHASNMTKRNGKVVAGKVTKVEGYVPPELKAIIDSQE
jgi:predicted HAD superfamily Cof-like phosphohydrolase